MHKITSLFPLCEPRAPNLHFTIAPMMKYYVIWLISPVLIGVIFKCFIWESVTSMLTGTRRKRTTKVLTKLNNGIFIYLKFLRWGFSNPTLPIYLPKYKCTSRNLIVANNFGLKKCKMCPSSIRAHLAWIKLTMLSLDSFHLYFVVKPKD